MFVVLLLFFVSVCCLFCRQCNCRCEEILRSRNTKAGGRRRTEVMMKKTTMMMRMRMMMMMLMMTM